MSQHRLLQYDSQYPLYGLGFSHSTHHPLRIALTTLLSGPSNKLLVLDPSSSTSSSRQQTPAQDFPLLASVSLTFPATKVGWEPTQSVTAGGYEDGGRAELLATTGDVLRIWDLGREWEGQDRTRGYVGGNGWTNGDGEYALNVRSVLTNSKSPQMSLPPISSFSWNPMKPELIVTCSVDTTATLWDINTSQALTQLIAHDRAVFDLAWLPQSPDIFVSVGADGSLRAFDLRQLEHSTILYESASEAPLARIAFSSTEQHMLACFALDDQKVLILDMRSPGQPVAELVGHQGSLGAIAWGAGGDRVGNSGGGWLASCGDDSQLLLYDLTQPLPISRPTSRNPVSRSANEPSPSYHLSPPTTPAQSRSSSTPSPAIEMGPAKAWSADAEINNLAFSDQGDWLGCVSGQRLSVLKV